MAALEGDDRAVEIASRLARDVGLCPVVIPAGTKPLYHAGAVFASNYAVVLGAAAEQLFDAAGVSPTDARTGIAQLMRSTIDNMASGGARTALTGPVARGDSGTVRRHLATLPHDLAPLYVALARRALDLADLDPDVRAAVADVLDDASTV